MASRSSEVNFTKNYTLLYLFFTLVCENFSASGRPGGAGPLNVNLGPPIISETTGARKVKLKTLLGVEKYSLQVQKFFR